MRRGSNPREEAKRKSQSYMVWDHCADPTVLAAERGCKPLLVGFDSLGWDNDTQTPCSEAIYSIGMVSGQWGIDVDGGMSGFHPEWAGSRPAYLTLYVRPDQEHLVGGAMPVS